MTPPALYTTDELLPEYARVARDLHQMLSTMQVDERLLPERQLCVKLGVSRVTLRRAMEYFHRNHVLGARAGRGTWLARPIPPLASPHPTPSRLIGLVVPSVQQPLISRIVHGAERYAADQGLQMTLAQDHCDPDYQVRQLRRLAESAPGGIALFPDPRNLDRPGFLDVLRHIQASRIPLVLIDKYVPEIAASCVLSDNFHGAYQAAQHLILTGHRKLALLAFGTEGHVSDRDRRRGFLAALGDHGLAAQPVREARLGSVGHEASARRTVREWLAECGGRPDFDAVVCMQDNMAFGAFLALRDAGLRVPDDVALVGYDNLDRELFQAEGLRLTSIDQPAEKIGAEAARLLIARMEGREDDVRDFHLLLKPDLIVRESCGSRTA